MFNLNQCTNHPRIDRFYGQLPQQFIFKPYILPLHTNGRSIKNMIGVVVNRLVGMGLNPLNRHRPPGGVLSWEEIVDMKRNVFSRLKQR